MELVRINNPFQRQDREVVIIPFNNSTVEDILKDHLAHIKKTHGLIIKYEDAGDMIRVSINGLIIPPEFWDTTKPRDKDQIIFMPIVAKGDTEKQILNIVILIAVIIVLGPGGENLIGVFGLGATGAQIAAIGIIAGTGMLLQSMTPGPQGPSLGAGADDFDASNTFSWSPHTTQKQGIVKPRFYGTNKHWGNVIAVHTEINPDDDTKQNIKMLIGLGEGPVEGIVTDSIKVNDQNINNFTGITTEERKGTLNQTASSFFTETKPEYRPNRLVTNSGGPIIYTTPDADYDDLEIELLFARGIYFANNQGGLSEYAVPIKIEISESGAASWNTLVAEQIIDNTTSAKRQNYIASGTYVGGSPVIINNGTAYDIRVTKANGDQNSSRYGDQLRIGSVREVIEDNFIYPKTSLLGVEALATDQLSGALNVSCIQQDAIINVWNGSEWNLEFSDNPAWVAFDIMTQPIITGDGSSGSPYAINRYDGTNPSKIDLTKFYELALFCNDLVPDGNGGTEKRITFNGGFDIGTTPWQALLKVCEIARCMPIWTGSELTLAIDKPDTPKQMFNVSDINEDTFQETFMPQRELVSEIEVQYRDEKQDYKRVPFTILNDVVPNASKRVTLGLFGVTSESQAWRAAMHRLAQNQYLKSMVQFEADIDAVDSTIGNVVWVQHDVPEWGQGGRVISGTTLSIVVDKDMSYKQGEFHEVLVRMNDDALNTRLTTSQYNNIEGVSSSLKQFYIDGNFSNEYVSGDSIRVVDSANNDKPYTLSTGATFNGSFTTITVNEIIPDDTVVSSGTPTDGGLFNLRRIVVSSVFKNASDDPEAPVFDNIYTFGKQDLHARKYRIINMSKTIDQYITITAVEYNPLVYSPDAEEPIIAPQQSITNPESDNVETIVLNPAWGDIERRYPPQVSIGPANLDVPQITGIVYSDDVPNLQISWAEGILSYKGATYAISSDVSGTDKYIYWNVNSNPTTFQTSNDQLDGIGNGKFIMAVNNNGVAFPIGVGLPYWGELLVVETLSALTAQLGDVLAGTITGSIITGGLFRTSISGRRVHIDSDGIKLLYGESSGVIGTTGNGGDNIVIGTTGNGGDNEIVGAGFLATINSPASGKEIPFRIESEQPVADFHYFNRSNTPSGAATVGDKCVVQGIDYICTVAGTPGTWTIVGTQI